MKFDTFRWKSKLKKNIVHAPLLLVLAIVLSTGISGVDFGKHWDEAKIINAITSSIKTDILLPRWYNYPSLCYDLALVAFVPDAARVLLNRGFNFDTGRQKKRFINISKSHFFKQRIRIIFIVASYLSLFWTYFLVLAWRKSWIEALLASSLVGLSWEVAYHARWIAPDVIMMQFGALTMMCLFFAQNNTKTRLWLRLSAIAAGLACGTKYPGGLLLIPVLLVTYYSFNKSSMIRVPLHVFSEVLLIFALTYLITTPGTLLEPLGFIRDVTYEMRHYSIYGHRGYTVVPGIKHFLLVLGYFCLAVFSKYTAIASVFFVMVLIGIGELIKKEKKAAVVFLCFPFLYIIFVSRQKVMIARNLLVLIPFFAILASRGCIFLRSKFKYLPCRMLFSMSIVALLLINTFWLVKAANSIRIKDRVNYIEQLARYIDQRPDTLFLLSEPVVDNLLSFDKKVRSNIIGSFSDKTKAAIFYSSEVKDQRRWVANRFNYTWLWFGPYEVNFNYYPSWKGDRRIVVMPIKSALELEVFSSD